MAGNGLIPWRILNSGTVNFYKIFNIKQISERIIFGVNSQMYF